MKIQINTDDNVAGIESRNTQLIALLSAGLKRFSNQITRVEVHLSDEDGNKDGLGDKRCMLEARLKGMKPVAVTNYSNTIEDAVTGATDKLQNTLTAKLGRLRENQ